MSLPVIQTKLHVPSMPDNLVPREAQITPVATHRLMLISAPAGFGKTTLAVQYLQQLKRPTAWLSIDASHNNANVFGVYLVHALHQLEGVIDEALLAQVQLPQPPSLDEIIVQIINRVASLPIRPVLVLDDLHLIREEAVYQALDFLIANQPNNLYVMVTTREDPPLSLSRLRARQQLLEIRAEELRFSYEETQTFLNDILSLDLDAQQIRTLDKRTEGWITGLQFAGLSLQYDHDKTEFIRAFSASHRYVLDYLSDEVMRLITPDIREFLLKTSILDRLSGDSCNAVTLRDDSQLMLEQIEERNLFLIRLDHQRQWYRYHHLFADLLRQYLHRDYSRDVSALHLRASQWYERQDDLAEAVHHAHLSNHIQQLVEIIASHAMGLIMQGYVEQVHEWIRLLPQDTLWNQPRILMSYGWVLYLQNDMEELPVLLDKVVSITEQNDILGEAVALRAFLSEGDPDKMKAYALRALDLASEGNLRVQGMAYMALSDVSRLRDEKQPAFDQLVKVIEIQVKTNNRFAATNSLLNATIRCLPLAQWNRVDVVVDTVFTTFESTGMLNDPAMGAALIARGWLMLRRYYLNDAIREIRNGLKIASQSRIRALQLGAIPLIQAMILQGEADQIDHNLAKLTEVIQEAPDAIQQFLYGFLSHIYIDLGALEIAENCLKKTDNTIEDQLAVIRLQIFREQTNYADMIADLNVSLVQAESRKWHGHLTEALILRAILRYHNQEFDLAIQDTKYAIKLAQADRERLTFMQNMQYLQPVLAQLIDMPFVQDLMSFVKVNAPGEFSHPSLFEALSEREVDILQLMTQGLTYDAIGSELAISINTVRYHVKSLYGKLGVSSRADAIASARTLGWLS